MDADRVLPEALEPASRQHRPKGVFLIPTLQNPPAAVLPDDRRDAVAAIVERHGMLLVEDDIYRPFADDPPAPIAARIPEHAVYVTGASKHMAPGQRVGALHAPRPLRAKLLGSLRAMLWLVAPLTVEILVRSPAAGTAERPPRATRDRAQADGATDG